MRRNIRSGFWMAAMACTALLATACSSESSTDPDVSAAAGTYVATQLTMTENDVTTDQLERGAEITLVLFADGATSGHALVPANVATDDEGIDADLSGTWRMDGTTVTLSHGADTFLRDMPFTLTGNTLVGDSVLGGTRIQITLTRQ